MKTFIRRITTLLRRRQRAHRLGFRFRRAAQFALPSRLLIGSQWIHLALPEGNGTRTAFSDVLLDDCYRLCMLPNNVRSVVDIGAHVGLFSIAVRHRWPQAAIHAYEPNPALQALLMHHSQQALFECHAEAVGMEAGLVSLVPAIDSVEVRSVEASDGAIRQIAFHEVLSRLGGSADLVKLDCEGAEWQILCDKAAWQRVRFLTMEFHLWAGYSLDELESRISELGFCIRRCEMTGEDFGLLFASR